MFQRLKNIETAFKHVRLFSFVLLLAATIISCYALYWSFAFASQMQEKVYVLVDGKAIEVTGGSRKENIAVEARRHLKDFHQLFFSFSPDEQAIAHNIKQAFYLADQSAKRVYDDLAENGYYTHAISSNTSQEFEFDSARINTSQHPFYFMVFGKQRIVRPLSVTIRSLVTQGYLRDIHLRTDNNPAAFLIERWTIVENKDLVTEKR